MTDLTAFVATILASLTVSGALTAAIIWLAKNWIGERLRAAIQHEYDQKLEGYKVQLQSQHERSPEVLKAELGNTSAERDARRDYEYDARKKLYEEYEPLLFQLVETSENAYHRVLSLARTARDGDIRPDGTGWLERDGYYFWSTIYNILAPVALYRIIRRKLTFVDLAVDEGIAANYMLAKLLYLTLTSDFDLAATEPSIPYDPHAENAGSARQEDPQKYWKQGVPLGYLDNVIDDCLLAGEDQPRLLAFGGFAQRVERLKTENPSHNSSLFVEILKGFHPDTRPVLWRILITQAHIHRLLVGRVGARSENPRDEILSNLEMPEEERKRFRWGNKYSSVPFESASAFIRASAFSEPVSKKH